MSKDVCLGYFALMKAGIFMYVFHEFGILTKCVYHSFKAMNLI